MKEKKILSKLKIKERDLRKNIIMDAAEKVFANKPFDKVSMQEIANEAGLAKSSIYTYFPNQETLFVEAYLRDLDVLLDDFKKIMEGKRKFDLEVIIETFINHFFVHDSFFRMAALFMLHGNLSEESQEKMNPAGRQMLDLFDRIFITMNYKGDVRLLSHTFFAAINGILISYRKYPGRSDAEIIRHMKKIGKNVKKMLLLLLYEENS